MKHFKGFTLIELMIVLVIVAILASVALPSYQNQVQKSRRTVAKGTLMDMVNRQEQFFANNKSYTTSLADLGLANPYYVDAEGDISDSDSGVYQLTITAGTVSTFTVQATPKNVQAGDSCGNLTVNAAGERAASGSGTQCW